METVFIYIRIVLVRRKVEGMQNSRHSSYGFTLIELMLSMSFIAVLLIAIAATVIQISNIYTKGVTLKEVNQAGRSIAADLQRTIGASTPFDLSARNPTSPGGGRLCTGQYTYAWNYGSSVAGGPGAPAVYNRYTDNSIVNFAKVRDPGAELCADTTRRINKSNASELLTIGDRNLAVHVFTVTTAPSATDIANNQALYSVRMTLGTNDKVQLVTNNTACKPPADGEGLEDYCSVNTFEIVARAGNNGGEE